MPPSAVFLIHRALPGRRADVRTVWERHLRPAIAANPAHEAYAYCDDDDDADTIRVYQRYVDAAAARAFLATPAYAAYVAEVTPLLAAPPEVFRCTPTWVKP